MSILNWLIPYQPQDEANESKLIVGLKCLILLMMMFIIKNGYQLIIYIRQDYFNILKSTTTQRFYLWTILSSIWIMVVLYLWYSSTQIPSDTTVNEILLSMICQGRVRRPHHAITTTDLIKLSTKLPDHYYINTIILQLEDIFMDWIQDLIQSDDSDILNNYELFCQALLDQEFNNQLNVESQTDKNLNDNLLQPEQHHLSNHQAPDFLQKSSNIKFESSITGSSFEDLLLESSNQITSFSQPDYIIKFIVNTPKPNNQLELRSLLTIIDSLNHYMPELYQQTLFLRALLLIPTMNLVWDRDLDHNYQLLLNSILSIPPLTKYNNQSPLHIIIEIYETSLAASLEILDSKGKLSVLEYFSTELHSTELHSTKLHSTKLHSTELHSTKSSHTLAYQTVLHHWSHYIEMNQSELLIFINSNNQPSS